MEVRLYAKNVGPHHKGETAPLATVAIGGPPYACCLVIIGSETEPGR